MTLIAPRPLAAPRSYLVFPPAPAEVERLCEELSVSPTLAQILVNRGLGSSDAAEAFLLGGHELLLDPELLEGIPQAADIVADAVRHGQRLLIHGDYDADGVSGTALLVAFLRDIGADAHPYIPHRIDEGYGLSAEGAQLAAAEGYHVMVSVDCGSSSPHVVELARSLGLRVVITDHHMVSTPPPADAFVNPRAPGSTYPFPHLSGAGVAFKLVQAVSRRLGCGEPEAYLDLAAIGTVGDVVPLTGENRILVREGLAVMERLERPGIAALARVAGLGGGADGAKRAGEVDEQPIVARAPLSARDIGFEIAPRINACGRLEHALQACLLLLETDEEKAMALAVEVDALNRQRREMESALRLQAEEMVQARGLAGANVIVEAHADWHQGIVGITANRLLDRYGLPAFVISIAEDGSAKGSARAPAHIDLYACLQQCADLFTHYGGHPRAGGFSLPADRIDALRARLQEVVPTVAGPPEPALRVDLEIPLERIDLSLVEELDALAPLGQANPPPLFLARGVRLRYAEKVKDLHWRFLAVQPDASARCIAFNLVERLPELRDGDAFDMIFEVDLDRFRGEVRLSYKVRELIPLAARSKIAPSQPPLAAQRSASNSPSQTSPPHAGAPSHIATPHAASMRGIPLDGGSSNGVPSRDASASGASPSEPFALPVSPLPPENTWEWVDARSHDNRGRYLADVVAEGHPTFVLCRRDQVSFVQRVVAAGRPQPPSNMQVLPYGAEARVGPAAQWVLFSPPPSLEALRPMLAAGGGRCHVVFGTEQLDEEGRLIDAVDMSRERLERVYRVLKSAANGQGIFDEAQFPSVLEKSRQYDFRVETLKVGTRIFSEMGVVSQSARYRGRYRFTGARAELERSSTYLRYAAMGTRFASVRALFCRDASGWGEGLMPVLNG